jgi:alkanesulfonate monooxygenase SsuD/methylene tetrahydromethanopterin reductase-like flavin-dependent oxidoreductase (luciferase family)
MVLSILRLDMRAPASSPASAADLYAAALDMAQFADEHAFTTVVLSEHHFTDDGFLPSPIPMAGAVAGRTRNVMITVSALLAPLYEPLRLAEDIAVLDNLSGGRVSYVMGLGYRRIEYDALGFDWTRRGRILDDTLDTVMTALRGEPFEYRGHTVQVLPRPRTRPHPLIMVGGSSDKAAQRAARLRLPFMPALHDPELTAAYERACADAGFDGGFVLDPGDPALLLVADDVDRAWEEYGPYILHDARTYASWQTADVRSGVKSEATTVDGLRAEGRYVIMTPDECVARAEREGPTATFIHFPLVGGCPPELGWRSLRLWADEVVPRLA